MDEKKMTALETTVLEVDGNSPEAQAAQAQQVAAEATDEAEARAWAMIPTTVGKLVCMVAPELQSVYSGEACTEWGQAMVPVAKKHGWTGPSAMPELELAICTAGFAIPSYLILRAKLEIMREAKRKAAPAPAAEVLDPPAVVPGDTRPGAEDGR